MKVSQNDQRGRCRSAEDTQLAKEQWLRAETEDLIIAAQDQRLVSRSYHHRIMIDGTTPHCRICGKYQQTIDHIVSDCPQLAKTEYTYRHHKVAAHQHWKVCRYYSLETTDKWYDQEPRTITESDDVTILSVMPIHTDREKKAKRSDIVIKDKRGGGSSKEVNYVDCKFKDLEIEISRMSDMKTETTSVVIGALGLVKKGLERYTNNIPGNINIL